MGYKDWSPSEVARQLRLLGFGQYAHEFQNNEICGVHLPLITEDHLKEMGVTSIGHRILMIRRFMDIANGKLPKQGTSLAKQSKTISSSSPALDSAPSSRITAKTVQEKPLPKSSLATTRRPAPVVSKPVVQPEYSESEEEAPPVQSRTTRRPPQPERKLPEPAKPVAAQDNDFKVACQYCGRKMHPDAAKRHIPVCGRINQNRLGKQ